MAQTVGYLIAAAGPLLVGAIYQHTDDWNIPMLIVAGILIVELIVALPAGRNVKSRYEQGAVWNCYGHANDPMATQNRQEQE